MLDWSSAIIKGPLVHLTKFNSHNFQILHKSAFYPLKDCLDAHWFSRKPSQNLALPNLKPFRHQLAHFQPTMHLLVFSNIEKIPDKMHFGLDPAEMSDFENLGNLRNQGPSNLLDFLFIWGICLNLKFGGRRKNRRQIADFGRDESIFQNFLQSSRMKLHFLEHHFPNSKYLS